jgi:coproporphyrinogen III oxidase-like Fe-S oxidoreductase
MNISSMESATSTAAQRDEANNFWTRIDQHLRRAGFNRYEVEAILDSDLPNQCREELNGRTISAGSLKKFLVAHGHVSNSSSVNALVLTTFPELVANEHGEPCRATTNLMSGQKILVPIGTPISCDPSSETYWSS